MYVLPWLACTYNHSGIFLSPMIHSPTRSFVCVDALHPSRQFISHVGIFSCTKQRIKSLAQGHNTVPLVSLESQVLHSTD